ALDVARVMRDCAIQILDGVGAPQREVERTVDAQALHGQSFLQPFAQRAGGAGMLALKGPRQALQLLERKRRITAVPCVVDGPAHVRALEDFALMLSTLLRVRAIVRTPFLTGMTMDTIGS